MIDFCGFFQGKSSEFAWIPGNSLYNAPAKKVSNKIDEDVDGDVAEARLKISSEIEVFQSLGP